MCPQLLQTGGWSGDRVLQQGGVLGNGQPVWANDGEKKGDLSEVCALGLVPGLLGHLAMSGGRARTPYRRSGLAPSPPPYIHVCVAPLARD